MDAPREKAAPAAKALSRRYQCRDVAEAALTGLARLAQPDEMQRELSLPCTEQEHSGWQFATEYGTAEPVFGFGGYLDGVAAEGVGPVVAEWVIAEDEVREFLQFLYYHAGIEVFLDGTLLYTDFPNAERGADGFLVAVDPTDISRDGLRLPLPMDCVGKTLCVVTYTFSYDGLRQPVLPALMNRCRHIFCWRRCRWRWVPGSPLPQGWESLRSPSGSAV